MNMPAPNRSNLFPAAVANVSASLSSASSESQLNSRPTPNHGKPNFAPKPPGIQQIIAAKSAAAPPPPPPVTNGTRPSVSRHHSMKTPR